MKKTIETITALGFCLFLGLMLLLFGTSLVDNLLYRAMSAIWSPVITFFYRLVWR